MLSNQQQALVQAIQQLDLDQVQSLLAEGLDPNFIDPEHGFPVSILCDGLYLSGGKMSVKLMKLVKPLTESEKQQQLKFIWRF